MNILIAMSYHAGNAAQTERLLDLIYQQRKIPRGHILLSVAQDVHAEMKKRVEISAEMAFEGVYSMELRPLADQAATKNMQVNNAFRQTAEFIRMRFTWPFLWMEPDTVPMMANWLEQLQCEYQMQPKQYFGSQMKAINKAEQEQIFMARTGIYPNVALPEDFPMDKASFEINAGQHIYERLTPTKRIQQLSNSDQGGRCEGSRRRHPRAW